MIEYADSRHEQAAGKRAGGVGRLAADAAWSVFCACAIALFAFGLGAGLSPMMGYMGLMFALLAAVALSLRARTVRRARAMVAVNYLEQAARLNLPFPPMLAAAESAERGGMRRRLARLRAELEMGSPVAAALARAAPGGPPRVVGLIAAGERLGRLPQALERATATERALFADRRRVLQAIMIRWYPTMMVVGIVPIFALVMLFVLPKYKQMFNDFGLRLPTATVWLLDVGSWMESPIAWIAMLILVFLVCGSMFADLMPLRRPALGPLRWMHRLVWFVPPWRGVTRNRGLADACHVIADALAAGQPADRALAEASDACGNLVLREQVLRWSDAAAHGMPLADAAQRAGMPALVVGLLRPARDAAGLADAFAFLTRYYDARFSVAAALLRGAAIPLMVAVMGLLVLTVALGLFAPLVELMKHLPGGKGVM